MPDAPANTQTSPAQETPPKVEAKPPVTIDDPWLARTFGDLGKIVKDGQLLDSPSPAAVEPTSKQKSDEDVARFTTLGEHARFKAERDKAPKEEEKAQEKKEPEKKEEKPAEQTNAEPEKKAEAEKKKIVVEQEPPLDQLVEGLVKKVLADKPAPAKTEQQPSAPAKKEETSKDEIDSKAIAKLPEEEREAVELAQYAAIKNPEKYGDLPGRMLEYFKKVDDFISKKLAENPEWDSESDESFASWVEQNNPSLSKSEARALERQKLKEEAVADARKEFEKTYQPRIDEVERTTKAQAIKPELDAAVKSFETTISEALAADKESPFATAPNDPLAADVAKPWTDRAARWGKAYMEIATGVRPFSESNKEDMDLFKFITDSESWFRKNGGDARVIDGKMFATREEWQKMAPEERSKHWILSHVDVLDTIKTDAVANVKAAYKVTRERLDKAGYKRISQAVETPKEEKAPAAQAKTEGSPKATVSAAPGAAQGAGVKPPASGFSEEELKRQWSGGAATMRN